METDIINSYHAHVYFDAESMERARDLCERAAAKFGLRMGHMHEQPVGPHPMWSCQITARPAQFAELLPWLVLNRKGLIVFSHPETGQELEDHRDHGIWLGVGLELNLAIFE